MLREYLTMPMAKAVVLTTLALSTTIGASVAYASSYAIEVRYAETGELLPAAELTSLELYSDGALVEIVEPYGGVYIFSDLEPDHTYQVDAYGTYMWLASISRYIGPDEAAGDVIIAPYLGTLLVRVLHSDGITPLDNAQVEVRSHGGIAWRAGISTSDGWVSWGGSDRTYLFPNRLPGEQWTVHTSYEGLGVAYPVDVHIVEQGELTISITTTVAYDTAPQTPIPISPPDDAVLSTLTPTFQWSPFQHGGDQQTQAGHQLRVRCDDYEAWDFSTPTDWGVPPAGWVDDSSSGSTPTYRVTTFNEAGCFHLKTLGGTSDRIKAMTIGTYRTGTYDWKVYIPPIDEPGASNSIAAWLYSPQSTGDDYMREIDFEIGYGTAAERAAYAIPDGKLMVYMTVQRDYSTGTNNSTHAIPIDPDAWHTLRLLIAESAAGQYQVSWLIKEEGEALFSIGRPDYVCGYGPVNTVFQVACSLENDPSLWIGDFSPLLDKYTYFDYVTIMDVPVYDTGFLPSASVDSHTYEPGLYTGFDSTAGSLRLSDALVYEQHYHWHVRYCDSGGDWSNWSSDDPALHQDFYTAQPVIISGRVTDSTGLGIADVTIDGLPGSPVTDGAGEYDVSVSTGFSGTAVPVKPGHLFVPASRAYDNVMSDQPDQDFTGTLSPDSDGDGVPDALDMCPGTIPEAPVDATGCPPYVPGDCNRDGDVDVEDYGVFATCLAGPGSPQGAPPCQELDFDGDGDVDQFDFAILQLCFSGMDLPADPSCSE